MKAQWYKRLLSTILVLTLFVQLVPAQVWATVIDTEDSPSTSSVATTDDVPVTIIGEEESLRTESEKHFRMSDGSFIAVSYGMPVHYQDAAGNWEDIDNTLLLSADQSVYTATNAQFATAFSANLATGRVLTSSYNGLSVSMSLLDQSEAQTMVANSIATMQARTTVTYDRTVEAILVSNAGTQAAAVMSLTNDTDSSEGWTTEDLLPEKLHSSVIYEDVYPGVDLLYTAYGYNIKEQIIVNEAQSAYRYDFYLQTEGLAATLNADSSITLADSTGNVIYEIPAPYMADSAGATSDEVTYTLTAVSGGYVLTVTADATWINSADRVFPVTIDPTLEHDASTSNDGLYCTYVKQGDPDKSHPKYQQLYFGYSSKSSKEHRIFMHLKELPTIPADSVVTDAILGMYLYDYSNVVCNNLPAAIFEVTDSKPDTSSSYKSWINYLTWNTQPTYNTDNIIDYVNIWSSMAGKYISWDLTELVKKWYATGTDNRTFAMAITAGKQAWSSSYCAVPVFLAYGSAHPPVIAIMYRNNTGIEDYYTYTTLGGGEAGTAYIADATGQLKIAKGLVSYASTSNPFAMSLVYNSDYFASNAANDYHPPKKLGTSMDLGTGWTLDVIQKAESVTISDTVYIKYTDGDGTVHYFRDDPADGKSVYYDEDGLGLEITAGSNGNYTMTDRQGNIYTFTNTYLTSIADENGNQYLINYTDGKITTIQQKNNRLAAITVATFGYTDDYVSTITDAAGIVYTLGYSDGKLVTITQGTTQIAAYSYTDNRVVSMADSQCAYSIVYTYNVEGKISHYHEVGASGAIGAQVDITYDGYDKTTYRNYGLDRIANNADDVITHYLFDYAGRTANAYSTDSDGNIIGASNAIYTGTGSVDKTNNRTLRTASTGIAAEQEMLNSGLESSDTANQWTMSTGFACADTKPHTGAYSLKGSPTATTDILTAVKASRTLHQGQIYTLSAYVHTSDLTISSGGGVFLTVTDGTNSWTSDVLGYETSENVDGGWTRISVTFTAQTTVAHSVGVSATGVTGAFYVDDFLLERGEAPSNRNLLENGNFQIEDYAWTFGNGGEYQTVLDLNRYGEPNIAPKIASSTFNETANISQTITVNLPGTESFVLSGWAQGNAVPDNTDKTGVAHEQDIVKAFGLRAVITYSDETQEYFYASFNADITQWQFTSLTIVPKSPDKTIATITVICAFERNANTAKFDNISLVRQTARSMEYDEEGNLLSASTTGITEDQNTYDDNGNLIKTVTGTGSTIEYFYDGEFKHRLTSYTNSLTTTSFTYDTFGNVEESILSASGSTLQIRSSSVYSQSGNLVESVTNSSGSTTSYAYSAQQNIMLGLPSAVTAANGTVTNILYDNFGRTTQTTVASSATLVYNYSNGNLASLVRTVGDTSQTYAFTYDAFGNMTAVRVGNTSLASYTYADGNGPLLRQTYANGDTVTFTYDYLGRIKTETLDDGRVVTYTYNGEGQLYCVKETKGSIVTAYYYTYDSNGRLVSSEMRSTSGESLMRVNLCYNQAGQLVGQTWNIGGTEYTEGYTYNSADGSLNTFTTGTGETLTMSYDSLRRVNAVSSSRGAKRYTYRSIDGQATTQVSRLQYTNFPGGAIYDYSYDAMGNITTHITPYNEVITYTYDAQGQLLSASDGSSYVFNYTYDSAGNILTANNHTYTYGNTTWPDLLTAFDGEAITYDTSGNPTSYYNGTRWTFTWENGRSLATATDGTTNISYTYDASGLRTSKTVDGVTHYYYYAGGKLLRETYGDNTLDFFYDENGYPYAFEYNGALYYYITNLHGDVEYILNSSRNIVGQYWYDPYGNIVYSYNTPIEKINPLRYRGYYFDSDTGLYYLQSRYYDPAIGRFINADVYTSTGQGMLGHNMFAYCLNNPVNAYDSSGTSAISYTNGDRNPLFIGYHGCCGGGAGGYPSPRRKRSKLAEWLNDTFGAGVVQSNSYAGFSFDTLFGGTETGFSTSTTVSGDVSKPVSAFAEIASDWWKITEYKIGAQINIGNGGFSAAYGLGETSVRFSSGGGTTIEAIYGANKIGLTVSQDADFGSHTAGPYTHVYLRTLPTAGLALLLVYAPEAFAALGGALVPSLP